MMVTGVIALSMFLSVQQTAIQEPGQQPTEQAPIPGEPMDREPTQVNPVPGETTQPEPRTTPLPGEETIPEPRTQQPVPSPQMERQPPTRPPEEMSRLTEILPAGTYRCEGEASPPGRSSHRVRGTAKVERDLNGFWHVVEYKERKSRANPQPYSAQQHFSYDADQGQYVVVTVDNMGEHTTLTAPAIEGRSMTFTGDVSVEKMPGQVRYMLERTGPRELKIRHETEHSAGTPQARMPGESPSAEETQVPGGIGTTERGAIPGGVDGTETQRPMETETGNGAAMTGGIELTCRR